MSFFMRIIGKELSWSQFLMVKKGDIPNSEWKKGKADP